MIIDLGRGLSTTIDEDDYSVISPYKWRAQLQHGKWHYAVSCRPHKYVQMHRVILGAKVGQIVDHANGNRLDNRRSNLRFATPEENSMNNAGSGRYRYKGVCKLKSTGLWRAAIGYRRSLVHIGTFDTIEMAAAAYDAAAKLLFKEFARLNFPHSSIEFSLPNRIVKLADTDI